MKTLTTIRILISLLAVNAGVLWGAPTAANPTSVTLPAPTPYAVVSRDAHSRVWERTVYERGPSGQAIASKHRYVELATGLNFWDSTAKQWQESQELIESFPGGAIARQGQHQVIFANNLATMGAIDMQTPDGKRLRSHVLGLSYFDTASGQSVLIAEVKDSQGQLYPPNVVIYPDAFTDFKADVRYTYTRAGFEQDIILHERPPGPEAYGLNPATTRLQVLTEFLNPPQPGKKPGALKTRQGDALDEDLDFGVMKMGHGKAFSLERGDGDIPVSKQWLKLGGRDFLVEEVAVPDLEEEIQALPSAEGASLNPAAGSVRHMVSKQRRLPAMPLVRAGTNEMQLARLSLPSQGLVLDYVTMTAQTNYTFQGDSTYYISGIVYLYGTNTFEGGAVIKYTNGAAIYLVPSAPGYGLNWQASAYRPVVFTSMNDNSVGESISSSTGNPTNDYFANPALNITGSTTTISYFRIAYARQAISLMGGPPNFYHGQIVNCNNGITTSGANTIFLRNILFGNVCTNFNNLLHGIFDVQNSTFSGSSYLSTIQNQPYQSSGVTLTNCLLVNVTNLQNTYTNIGSYWVDGGYNGFYNTPMFGSATVSSPFLPFQQVGAGNYYLTNGCSFLNAGTNNIDAILLASLKQKTTFPPVVYSNLTISVDTNFIPQVQRDTNSSPSLGYHYDPIDYLVDLCSITNATLTMTNGTAIATYNEAGFRLQDCSKIISTGSPDSPNWFVRYSSVQEQPISLNGTYGGGIAVLPSYTSVMPSAQYRFTKFACPAGGGIHLYDYVASSYSNLLVQDCEFWSGANTLGGTDGAVLTLKNNLFVRSVINASGNGSLSLSNTLAWGVSSVQLNPLSTNIWYAFNNDFDSCNITTSTLTNGCNAYLNCSGRLYPTNAYDVVSNATLACQTGPLGNYYQPTNSPLINAGSTTADKVGLYHYTTTTNEVKETNSPVDIGYHYVALNPQLSTINPVDSNGDGIPDYLEDANGNGLVDSGETAWMLLPPVITTQPQSQTVTAGNGATFNVAATGTSPLYYQWRKSGSTLTDGDNISGANSNILTLTSLTPWDAGIYTVMVSNAAGSVTSLYAVLRVWTPSGVFAWGGDGGYGFGNTNVPPGLTNVVGIAAGGYHSLALNGDGTVVGWGDSSFGQLPVPSGLTNLVAIAAGGFHSLAIKSDGTLVAWGYNLYGEANVPSGVTNVAAIAGGLHHSLAVKSDGTVVAWGYNSSGQTNVPVGLTNVVAVAGGIYHSLALKDDGTVVAWGDNTYGQTNVPSGLTHVVAIASGLIYNLALKDDGTVVAWGTDGAGDTDVPAGLANVVAITAGWYTSLALKSDGTVVVWGLGNYGQTNVPPGLTNLVGIAAGRWHCLALGTPPVITTQPQSQTVTAGNGATFNVAATGTGPLYYQWRKNGSILTDGDNIWGANSSTLTLTRLTPWDAGIYTVVVSNAAGSVTSLYAVLRVWTPSGVVAWGYNGYGETNVPSGLTNVVAIAAGGMDWSLALKNDGMVAAWGDGFYTGVPSDLTNVVAIAAGWDHSLALKGDGTVVGWGSDGLGQTDVPAGLTNVVAISAGWWTSLALKNNGTVVAWGEAGPYYTNVLGALAGLTNVIAISAGDMLFYAVRGDGTMFWWDVRGEYGESIHTNIVAIASGFEHYLGLRPDGTVITWGDNTYGECDVPSDLTNAVSIAASLMSSLALKADGTVVAWGSMNVPSGLTNVVAIAEGDGDFHGDFSLALVNIPPVITTQPQNQTVTAGANVTFNVTATGIPLNYQWFFNGVPLAGANSATLILTNVQPVNAGNYFVNVFNCAGSVFSTLAGLTVQSPPTVNLTSPSNGQFFNVYPTNLTLTASAGDTDGYVVSVAYYNGANLLGSATVPPYTVTWNSVSYGSYALTARATDDSGLVTTSSVVNITVDALPVVSVTSPANGTTIVTPTNLTVSASASDSDGTVTQLQIFAGTNLLGTSGTSPYSLVWSNVPPGTWNLTAVATDNLGAIRTSSPVTLTVNSSTNLPAIADAHVRDGTYSNANYGTSIVMECLSTNGSGNNRDIYFKFDVSNISSNISSAKLNVFAAVSASGGVANTVYAVTNTSWAETTITWSNKPARGAALSTNNVSGTSGSWYLYDVTGFIRSQKTAGSNWVSLALHDPTNTTRLITINSKENSTNKPALIILTTNPPPTVSITSPTNNTVYVAPAGSITINATAGDDGSVGQVQFFQGTTSLGVVTTPPYSVTWNNVAAGTYALKAVATDNYGLATTSSVVNVIVDIPPTVTLTNPANNSIFVAGTNVTIGATASDADGTVKQVQFFRGTNNLGIDTNAPFGLTWSNAAVGIYALTAIATDNNGITTTSAPVNIIVDALPMILITNPVSNTSFTGPTNITIAATASNSDGTMPRVQFSVGGILLGTCTNQPYGSIWTNPPVGKFVLTAVATDDYGLVSISTVTNITVNTNLPTSADAHVRDGSFTNTNFGTSTNLEDQSSTVTGTNRDAYFKFDVSNLSSNISSAQLKVFAAVNTNGIVTNTVYAVTNTSWVETTITWSNKPARGVALSTNNVSGTNGSWYLYDVTSFIRSQKTAGSNWVSLALHDPTNTTRLISINSRENATNNPALVIVTTNRPPGVSITSPTNNAVLSITTNLTISATASNSVGIYQVQFFLGPSTSLGAVTTPPYSVTWNNPLTGIYALTAVATDNAGLITTSSVVNVTVTFIVDTDGDGISDSDEINIYHTDPLVPNSAIPSSINVQTCPQ